ncbi:MAG TPA: DUF2130 domain-containing protein [Bacteroidales bacterium]|nr:DUF2130 domain-containing protein [Bacteroidales bacterium]
MSEKIKCPECGHHFDVEEALTGRIEARFKAEYEKKVSEQASRLNAEKQKLEEQRLQLDAVKTRQDELIQQELKKLLAEEKQKAEKEARESVQATLNALTEENAKNKLENKALKEKEIAMMKKEQELKEEKETMALEMERKLLERQQEIENKAREKEREGFEIEKTRLLKQIEDNKKLAEEMKRKAEQGSMQLQGEAQELALENLLQMSYPIDIIKEVPKGKKGADAIQTVMNNRQQVCGSIVYESKNTKAFGPDWIAKLKQDQIACKADLAVIVTQAMPQDMERFGEKDGVWICGFHEVKSLSFVLREILIRTHAVKQTETNKGDKMELLYKYLTSNEFVQNIKRIMENYDEMQRQLNQEKSAMTKIWAQREKQIWVVQENISAMLGSIKGIAGNELESAEVLELPGRPSAKKFM